MFQSSLSTESELDEASLEWATEQCAAIPRRSNKNHALFDLFRTRFGKTARAVRDFVTCSSPHSNGFMEDMATTTSQGSPIDLQSSSQHESTTDMPTTQQAPRDKPVCDVWSVQNGISPPREFVRHREAKVKARHPSLCHWRNSHGQNPGIQDPAAEFPIIFLRGAPNIAFPFANSMKNLGIQDPVAAANAESNRRACGAEVTSTSTCGPKLPSNFFELPTKQRLRAVKHFLADFVCKPNSETSLQANKQRPLCRLMATARMIVYKPEPIKSVEAVFLALYLTAGLLSVERTPLCFKTKFADEVSQHIVMLVHHNGKYGAFGISPNPDLMTKDFQFDSMSSIVEDYLKAYKAIAHSVLKVRIGLPVEHDVMSTHFICWRHLCLSPDVKSWAECVVEIENHVLRMRRLWDLWVLTGKADDPRKAKMTRRKILDPTVTSKPIKPPENKQPPVVTDATPPEAETPVKKPTRAPSHPPPRQWDAESTGSNTTDYCEHCEQLKREAPPSDTKRASVTTVKRIKTTSAPHNKFAQQRSSTHTSSTEPQPQQQQQQQQRESSYTGALLASAADQLGSSQQEGSTKPSVHFQSRALNHVSLAATKKILKNFVHSSVLHPSPPRRFTRRSHGARESMRKLEHPKVLPAGESVARRRKANAGPLYTFTLAQPTKSKAG